MKYPRALPIVAAVFASLIAPVEPLAPSAWAARNLVVADGPRAGSKWDPALTPYVVEIIDAFGPDGDINFGACRKSAQTGISEAAIALCGSYIDLAPCRIGYAVQTTEARAEFNREKLMPAIAATPVLKRKIRMQVSRRSDSSTEKSKRFPGGSLSLINANSASDLRSRTLKLGIGDEIDAWPDRLGEEGDPLDLYQARFMAFHATGDWRLFVLSTPTLLGHSRIDKIYKLGDQRQWHIACPACETYIPLEFVHLKFNRTPPFAAHYVAQCCGHPIEHHEKAALVRGGKFVAMNPQGLHPSWHVDALISQLTTWDKIAEAWWNAQGDEKGLRSFYNTWLGLPFEIRGDAPDHVRLLERKGGYAQGIVPANGLLLVAGCDVQHTGIWYEIVAFAPDAQSWTVEHSFLEGDTTDPERGAFVELAKLAEKKWPDMFGRQRALDALFVDAGDGGRYNQVLAFARGRPVAHAIKGVAGWTAPAVGTPATVEITLNGKKVARGARLWPVGTWPLKSTWYSNLRKVAGLEGQTEIPAGYCHFHEGCDERYFRQQTSEYLGETPYRGRVRREWKQTGPNHLLDCRIYAMAAADYLGLSRMTPEEWAVIARERGAPVAEPDLFAARPLQVQSEARIESAPTTAQPVSRSSWLGDRSNWLKRN